MKINKQAIAMMTEAAQVLTKKGQDYSGGDVNEEDYFKYQDVPSFDMLYTKVLRYRSLMTQDKEPNFESVVDTLVDLGNYAFRAAAYIKVKEQEDK